MEIGNRKEEGKEKGKEKGKDIDGGYSTHGAVGHDMKHALGWLGLPVPREGDGCDSDIEWK